jgi:hypothetical protein
VPDPSALDDIEQAFAARGSPAQVELAHLAGPEIGAQLSGRGYRLESFENVLGRDLSGGVQPAMTPGVEVRRSGEDELEAWLEVVPGRATAPAHRRRGVQTALLSAPPCRRRRRGL